MAKTGLNISASPTPGPQGVSIGDRVSHLARVAAEKEGVLSEASFHSTLTRERRRAERSRKHFVLMLLDSHAANKNGNSAIFIERLTSVVSAVTRETDVVGWYEKDQILAVIFTEISSDGEIPITDALHSKVMKALLDNLDSNLVSKLVVSVHLFPQSWDKERPERVADLKLYPDLTRNVPNKKASLAVKRLIDILGSAALLVVLSPILAVIALAIKLTSEGPVIFRQERLGRFGKTFQCLKFRTMSTNNDPKMHREYVRRLITGKTANVEECGATTVGFKIPNDPRVTPIGKFLRTKSLDELPQFWNVLRGEMSLVGPRPPLHYEFEMYDLWHRRRVLEVKPGVTGLWQVCERSRTCFDDMVRLDLRYSRSWSLWLDLKILFATPRAVITGDGAY